MQKVTYNHEIYQDDLDKCREIAKQEDRSTAYILRLLINYGANNWNKIRKDLK